MVSTASNIMCMYWEIASPPFLFVMSKLSFLDLCIITSLRFQVLAKTTTIPQKNKGYFCLLLVQLKSVVECWNTLAMYLGAFLFEISVQKLVISYVGIWWFSSVLSGTVA